jgi:hypothetical protein
MKTPLICAAVSLIGSACSAAPAEVTTYPGRWNEEQVNAWYEATPWPFGANYVPRYAINQLEMWQADTFDLKVIDEEFGWAAGLGMNSMRVFLHDILWTTDQAGLLQRMDEFLGVAEKHGLKIMFVFFDGVWDPHPYAGSQRPPRPHIHNSGWVQSPGRVILGEPQRHAALKPYVQGVLVRFKDDPRVLAWDLFNEPDNKNVDAYGQIELPNKAAAAHVLLEKSFQWAREVNPSQPITAGIWLDYAGWKKNPPIYQLMLANSDIITFHNYGKPDDMAKQVSEMKAAFNRPILCTEYMARPVGSTFEPILGDLLRARVGAYNWGFVNGKSQTIYPWETWKKNYTAEPPVWFHDIFHPDGTPYRPEEVAYIRQLTGKK